jgi:large subunit ribosomal protein L5
MAKVEKGKGGKGASPKSSTKKEAAAPEISQDSGNEHQFSPRLRDTYRDQVVPALMKEFGYGNLMQVPRLERIVLNVGMGEAIQNVKLLESASNELGIITGQKPVLTQAKKAIAGFKIREGLTVGVKVTLRGDRMWDFLDRLIKKYFGCCIGTCFLETEFDHQFGVFKA